MLYTEPPFTAMLSDIVLTVTMQNVVLQNGGMLLDHAECYSIEYCHATVIMLIVVMLTAFTYAERNYLERHAECHNTE